MRIFFQICAVVFFVSTAWAQNGKPTTKPTPYPTASPGQARIAAQIQREREWQRAGWTQNNEPFAKARREIDTKLKAGIPASKQARELTLKGADRFRPLSQFRWAYATYLSEMTRQANQNTLIEIGSVMDTNQSPGAYDWARLRFLVEASKIWCKPDDILPVGRRLLKRNPNDLAVRYAVLDVSNIAKSVTPAQRQANLALARQYLKKYPRSVRWLRLTAASARTIWFIQPMAKNKAQGHKHQKEAKGYYIRILKLLPANSPARRDFVELIVNCELKIANRTNITGPQWKAALAATKWK